MDSKTATISAVKPAHSKSKENHYLINEHSKNIETTYKLTSRSDMQEYDNKQLESTIEVLKNENNSLREKIEIGSMNKINS